MSPNAEPKRSKVCAVCGTESETFHLNYGASTCFSCRAFFRRAALSLRAKNATASSMKCKGGAAGAAGECAIAGAGARKCRRCRYEQCLRMGMKEEQVMSEDQKKCRFKRLIENQVQENFAHLLNNSKADGGAGAGGVLAGGERRKRGRKAKARFEDLPPEVLDRVKITFKRKNKKQRADSDASSSTEDCKPTPEQLQQSAANSGKSGASTPSEASAHTPPPMKRPKMEVVDPAEEQLFRLGHLRQNQYQHQVSPPPPPLAFLPPLMHNSFKASPPPPPQAQHPAPYLPAPHFELRIAPQFQPAAAPMPVSLPVPQQHPQEDDQPLNLSPPPAQARQPVPVPEPVPVPAPAEDVCGLDLTCKKEPASDVASEEGDEESKSQSSTVSYTSATTSLCTFKKSSLFHLNHIEKTWRLSAEASDLASVAALSPLEQLAAQDKAFADFAAQQPQLAALAVERRRPLVRAGARRFRQYAATRAGLAAALGLDAAAAARLDAVCACYPDWFTGFVAFACLFQGSPTADCTPVLDNICALKAAVEPPHGGAPFAELLERLDESADFFEDRMVTSSEELWLLQRFAGLHSALKEVSLPLEYLGDALTLFRDGGAAGLRAGAPTPAFLEALRRRFLLDAEVRRLSPEEGLLVFKKSLPDVLALAIARMTLLVRPMAAVGGRFEFVSREEERLLERERRFPGVNASWLAKVLRQNLDAFYAPAPAAAPVPALPSGMALLTPKTGAYHHRPSSTMVMQQEPIVANANYR